MAEGDLVEELPETIDGVLTIWLTEAGSDSKAREDMILLLKNSDIQFRNLRRIIKGMFNKEINKNYADRKEEDFSRGYKAALRDVHKIIPTTKTE